MNGMKVNLKAVPTVVWVCLTVAFLGVVTAIVVLSATGSDATDFRSFLNTMLNIVTLLVTSSAAVYSGAAAKNAQDAKEQTNGQLDVRIHKVTTAAVNKALEEKGVTGNGRQDV